MTNERSCTRPKCGNAPRNNDPSGLCQKHYELVKWSPYMPIEPLVAHIAQLEASGYSKARIGREANVSHNAIWKISKGKCRQVQRHTYDGILSVRIPRDVVAGGGLLPATGTRRRVQALMRLGWTQRQLASESGIPAHTISNTLYQNEVSARTAAAITTTFNKLQWQQPPDTWWSQRTRNAAARAGYLPPLAWDNPDDEAETPAVARELTTIEWHQELAGELSDTEIARELGIKPTSLQRALERAS